MKKLTKITFALIIISLHLQGCSLIDDTKESYENIVEETEKVVETVNEAKEKIEKTANKVGNIIDVIKDEEPETEEKVGEENA